MWGDDEGGEMVWNGRVSWGCIDGVYGCKSERVGGSGGGKANSPAMVYLGMKEQLQPLRAGLSDPKRKQYDSHCSQGTTLASPQDPTAVT